jgi:hypothetical protein
LFALNLTHADFGRGGDGGGGGGGDKDPCGQKVSGPILTSLRAAFNNTVRSAFWKRETVLNATSYSADQLARMASGKAPIGPDGASMEVHHKLPLSRGGTNDFSNLESMTYTDHRAGSNYRASHPCLFDETDD